MNIAEITYTAEKLLDAYRGLLKIDPVFKLSIETVSDADFASKCQRDSSSALCWILKLNTARHDSVQDVQYSVIDFLCSVMLQEMDFIQDSNLEEIRKRIVTRLTLALVDILPEDMPDEEES